MTDVASAILVPDVSIGVSGAARDLIWTSFFVDAGRGVTFRTHLPWHADPAVRSVVLPDGDKAAAAAVVRPAAQPGVAMIGYVCVAKTLRGQGHGRSLMTALNAVTDGLGYRAALLWTGKPEVYVGHGYETIGRDYFVRVAATDATASGRIEFCSTAWPGPDDAAGLPAFSTRAVRYVSNRATAVVAEGSRGATLIEWQGDPIEVAILLSAAGYATWSVNLAANDCFGDVLRGRGFLVFRGDGAFAMIRRTDTAFVPDPVPQSHRI